MNVAVGGTNGFFPDSVPNYPASKPWKNTSSEGPKEFWLGKDGWYPTWEGKTPPCRSNGSDSTKTNWTRTLPTSVDTFDTIWDIV